MAELMIPNEWARVNISNIADVDLGKTPKKSDYLSIGGYKVIKFRDVDYSGIDWTKNKDGFVGERSIGNLRDLKLHDVLITASAHSSEHIGRKICFVAKIPKDYKKIYFCGELLGISANVGVLNPKFCFYYFLSQAGYKEIQLHVKGGHLTSGQARQMSIPFTLLPEQNRIIEIVEELFSDLDNAIENLCKAQEQLKMYRQSVIKNSVDSIDLRRLGDLIESPKYGTSQKCKKDAAGRAVLRIPNIGYQYVDQDDLKFAEFNCVEIEKYSLRDGDLLMIRSNGSVSLVGKVAILRKKDMDMLYAGYLIRLRPKSELNSLYAYYALSSLQLRRQIELKAKSTSGVHNINSGEIQDLRIPFCGLDKQIRIVGEIESLLTICDQAEKTVEDGIRKAEALRQSILKKAFEGKLTEMWRKEHKGLFVGENSAKVMLNRIRAEKEALQNKLKGKTNHD